MSISTRLAAVWRGEKLISPTAFRILRYTASARAICVIIPCGWWMRWRASRANTDISGIRVNVP